MCLLDTDHLTILERGGPAAEPLTSRLSEMPPAEVATTIISYEEQTRGWMAYLGRVNSLEAQVKAYQLLRLHLQTFCAIPIVTFNRAAAEEWERLRRLRLRMGAMDLKIAAIALANAAVVVTRNVDDFRRVPRLRTEDWTAPGIRP